jgi:hypothetical protein
LDLTFPKSVRGNPLRQGLLKKFPIKRILLQKVRPWFVLKKCNHGIPFIHSKINGWKLWLKNHPRTAGVSRKPTIET